MNKVKDIKFSEIIELYDKKLDGLINKFEKNNENAKDIKQDIYAKLFSKKFYLEDCINSWGWLKTVVSNHCKNHLRDNNKINFIIEVNEENNLNKLENVPDKKTTADFRYDSTNIQEYIYRRVCSLKPKYKDVIISYDYEEMSYEQIAKKLNCPIGTVKSRLFKARMILKEELKELLD